LQSIEILKNVCGILAGKCVRGITANVERCRDLAERSLGMATVLNPHIGYERAASIAKEAQATGRAVRDIVLERGILSRADLERILDPVRMAGPAASPGTAADAGTGGQA
ncbi:MAG: aspartate ammonia-lyase, partial [Dehalococcoidia bacterium]|nr:aspartate ammonia-lyase [Dehalococcoidia bacterium]